MQCHHFLMSVLVIAGVVLLMAACGTRVIRPGEYPGPGEGAAFIRVKIEATIQHAQVHIFTKGDRFGSHKARIDASGEDDVYAFIVSQGEYDVGQISYGVATDIWPKAMTCPPFRVAAGRNSYAGTLKLRIMYPRYEVACDTSADSKAVALVMFRTKYADLSSRDAVDPDFR